MLHTPGFVEVDNLQMWDMFISVGNGFEMWSHLNNFPLPSCNPSSDLRLVVELQAASGPAPGPSHIVNPSHRLTTRAWTKLDLFTENLLLFSGYWKVPLRMPPINPQLSNHDINSVPQVISNYVWLPCFYTMSRMLQKCIFNPHTNIEKNSPFFFNMRGPHGPQKLLCIIWKLCTAWICVGLLYFREHPNNLYWLAQVQIPFHNGRIVIDVCCIYIMGIICVQQLTGVMSLGSHDWYLLGNRYPWMIVFLYILEYIILE